MRYQQVARLDALHRMQLFLDDNDEELGAIHASAARASLDQIITTLHARVAEQSAAETESTSFTKCRDSAREALRREHLCPLATIAGVRLQDSPNRTFLRMPAQHCSDSELFAAATDMAEASGDHRALFASEGLPADFTARLRAAMGALADVIVARDASRARRAAATAGIAEALTRASGVRRILDALVEQQAGDRPGLLGAWKQAKRVRRKPGRAKVTRPA